tara:strand:- start:149 stop:1045 length:897 start_codon:yes stop_codon:yes gene_type:complete
MQRLVTVLMAVYNGGPFLKSALESILKQTYSDFDFLIIDDASNDNTVQIINSYKDQRIKLISLNKNIGQTAALNYGLEQISTKWVARMYADDYSDPRRIEEQIKVINNDTSICCVGTNAWIFHANPNKTADYIKKPANDDEIKNYLLHGHPIIHASILIRLDILKKIGQFNEEYKIAADLDLYDRLLSSSRKFINIQKPLYGIRRHTNQSARSLIAVDETLDIFYKRLKNSGFSKIEKNIIHKRIMFFHLLRVKYIFKDKKFNGSIFFEIFISFKLFCFYFIKYFYFKVIQVFQVGKI